MDLYGLHLEVAFVARLREERRFNGVDELRAQIAVDVERSREVLAAGMADGLKGDTGVAELAGGLPGTDAG
jgi:riboflavin kinase/FMN adenylyltransferase